MMMQPYGPGEALQPQWDRSAYNPYQAALWDAFSDVYAANVFGFGHCRLATPGRSFNNAAFETWRAKCIAQWAREAVRTVGTRGLEVTDMSDALWLALYERMEAAAPFKPAPPLQATPQQASEYWDDD